MTFVPVLDIAISIHISIEYSSRLDGKFKATSSQSIQSYLTFYQHTQYLSQSLLDGVYYVLFKLVFKKYSPLSHTGGTAP